jgi:CheY-like chemotaxis protein
MKRNSKAFFHFAPFTKETLNALWFTEAPDWHCQATAEYLEHFGISVQFATSEADLAHMTGLNVPDVILADWDMDGINGRATVKSLFDSGRVKRATPAVLMTDHHMPQTLVNTLAQEGFQWVLRKPIVLSSLPKLIKRTVVNAKNAEMDRRIEKLTRVVQHSETASGAGYLAVC